MQDGGEKADEGEGVGGRREGRRERDMARKERRERRKEREGGEKKSVGIVRDGQEGERARKGVGGREGGSGSGGGKKGVFVHFSSSSICYSVHPSKSRVS